MNAKAQTTDLSASDAHGGRADGRKKRGPRTLERKTGDERWEELLRVSAEVFAERGYASTSLQEISERMGMLKGSLHYYIDSKQDLLYEVVRTVHWTALEDLQRRATGPGPAVQRLREVMAGHVVHLVRNMAATTVLLHEFKQLPPERARELSVESYSSTVKQLVREGQQDGSIRDDLDPSLITMALLGAVNWVYRWYRSGGARDAEEIGRQFAEIFTMGVEPEEQAG